MRPRRHGASSVGQDRGSGRQRGQGGFRRARPPATTPARRTRGLAGTLPPSLTRTAGPRGGAAALAGRRCAGRGDEPRLSVRAPASCRGAAPGRRSPTGHHRCPPVRSSTELAGCS